MIAPTGAKAYIVGGALDGSGDAVKGYVTRGGHMFTEETYVCTSEFQRRDVADRPPVIPEGARNFALLGSIRPPWPEERDSAIYHGIADPGWQWPACAH